MYGSILSFPMGEAESWDFSSTHCVPNGVGINQCCLLATMSIVAWVAPGLVTPICILWVGPSETLGQWTCKPTSLLPRLSWELECFFLIIWQCSGAECLVKGIPKLPIALRESDFSFFRGVQEPFNWLLIFHKGNLSVNCG